MGGNPTILRLAALVAGVLALSSSTQEHDSLYGGFVSPPDESRPLVWWHWMDGNVDSLALRKEIFWMHDIGLAGFHVFDAAIDTRQIVPRRLEYMSREWKRVFSSVIDLADSLGMEVGIASSPGWSESGGPWVQPSDAMKKLTWRELHLAPGQHYRGPLPEPFDVASSFQNIPFTEGRAYHEARCDKRHYEDIALLAVALPDSYRSLEELGCTVTSSSGEFSISQLTNDSMADGVELDCSGPMWVQFNFPQPVSMKSLSFETWRHRGRGHSEPPVPQGSLSVSMDGNSFRKLCDLPLGSAYQQTIDFEPAEGRFFRVDYFPDRQSPSIKISKIRLNTTGAVNHFEEKAAYAACHDIQGNPTPSFLACDSVKKVLDISAYCKDGILDWTAPDDSRWLVLRMGASLTGKQNHPASLEATGLEVSKLDSAAYVAYFRHYLDLYKDASSGRLGRRGIAYLLSDSYEACHDNGSSVMLSQFCRRRAYDPLPWLPVLTGMIVGSPEQSDAFLWDWRRTEGELFCENYSRLTRLVKEEYGMKGCYVESHENGRTFPADGMDIKKDAAYPMSACWAADDPGYADRKCEGEADIRESASVAHIYGQNRVAAESFTQNGNGARAYKGHPGALKSTADDELYAGVTRFVIHECAHQPSDSLFPGLTLGKYGQWFNRHETWAGMAAPWIDYLSRSCYLMMQGRYVADILYYYGEDNNVAALFARSRPDIPVGYSFDYAGPSVLRESLIPRNGCLVTDSGMSYRVLYIDSSCRRMSVDILEKILSFARAGVVICGRRPEATTGLLESCGRFNALVSEIWESGLENVIEKPLSAALGGIPQDVAFDAEGLRFVHRSCSDAQIYWVNNPSDSSLSTDASFRVKGLKPLKWDPADGSVAELPYSIENGRTRVSLDFGAGDAFFVVFRGKAERKRYGSHPAAEGHVVASLDSSWRIEFQKGRGADGICLENAVLKSLTDYGEDAVKYFSGVTSYSNHFTVPVTGRTVIDFGDVRELAQVFVNSQYAGTVWKKPFRLDISGLVRAGEDNTLEVRVANLWCNRLIGDCREGIVPVTWCSHSYFTASDSLLPAGLLGPVRIIGFREKP